MRFLKLRQYHSPDRGLYLSGLTLLIAISIFFATPLFAADKAAFGHQSVVDLARKLSTTPFSPSKNKVPQFLRDLTSDQWREIQYRQEKGLWSNTGLPFQVQFFHPGLLYDRLVKINIVNRGEVTPLPFDPQAFDYGSNHNIVARLPKHFGYAGFRLLCPSVKNRTFEPFAVFLGASYFRAVANGQVLGLSARGLAIDTAMPDGEEFPYFKEFWIQKPRPSSKAIVIHALLDSESVTGAYTFVISGGNTTNMDVTATLFLRKPVAKLGLAPLTSMFLFGENTSPRTLDDFHPEVHDSDGLLIKQQTGEWFWRPLTNPGTLHVDGFKADNPEGFGLIQRDHDFDSYQDLQARYERRPSLWIAPKGKWGHGHVDLIRIPTDKSIHNNIMAYWTPQEQLQPGVPYTYEYGMSWYAGRFTHPPLGFVTATRTGSAPDGARRFVIDFESNALRLLGAKAKVRASITCGKGATVVEQHLQKNKHTGGWRLSFAVRPIKEPSALEKMLPTKPQPVDLRAFLTLNDTTLTETWNYDYQP